MSPRLPGNENLFDDLRRAEQAARAELLAGCAQDAARIEDFFTRTLDVVRCEALAAFERKSLDRIGSNFVQLVSANVGLRLRARFRIYVNALAHAEVAIAANVTLPRMFPVRGPAFGEVRVPSAPATANGIEYWTRQLQHAVVDALRDGIDGSLARVLSQGTHRLCVVKARIDLAQRLPAELSGDEANTRL